MLFDISPLTVPVHLLTMLLSHASSATVMSRFPNGRPENILEPPPRAPTASHNHPSDNGAVDDEEYEPTYTTDSTSDSADTGTHRHRRTRAKDPSRFVVSRKDGKTRVPWIEYDIVQG